MFITWRTALKIMEFVYTKNTGESKARAVLVMQEPQQFLEGIDLSDLPEDEFAEFVSVYSKAYDAWRLQSQTILNEFELKHNYRRFKPEGMSEATVQYV